MQANVKHCEWALSDHAELLGTWAARHVSLHSVPCMRGCAAALTLLPRAQVGAQDGAPAIEVDGGAGLEAPGSPQLAAAQLDALAGGMVMPGAPAAVLEHAPAQLEALAGELGLPGAPGDQPGPELAPPEFQAMAAELLLALAHAAAGAAAAELPVGAFHALAADLLRAAAPDAAGGAALEPPGAGIADAAGAVLPAPAPEAAGDAALEPPVVQLHVAAPEAELAPAPASLARVVMFEDGLAAEPAPVAAGLVLEEVMAEEDRAAAPAPAAARGLTLEQALEEVLEEDDPAAAPAPAAARGLTLEQALEEVLAEEDRAAYTETAGYTHACAQQPWLCTASQLGGTNLALRMQVTSPPGCCLTLGLTPSAHCAGERGPEAPRRRSGRHDAEEEQAGRVRQLRGRPRR